MKRFAGVIGVASALVALLLLVVGVREAALLVPLFVIGLVALSFTVGGRAGAAASD